ncbi:DnaA regulatory inactivator Hda [Alkalimonas delamerensis]|uniref:DnaA regulatory inactivator Hda n=1 Tax=Alkalimonas delamerensis TaxID=265981 RepID=A0ABT9GPG4_9GAMM|nr:DnaA regulatory inactivator Hda [Alkalimonas delamerensis]MDP4528857.1 DnaA regulatory inactivator Hda [Alkalimonas delamerensis]
MQPTQFTLPVTLPEDETLDSFFSPSLHPAVDYIRQYLAQPAGKAPLYLFGASGCGKSHLLYAACVQAQEMGLTSQLLALEHWQQLDARVLDDLEHLDLVCLDNVQAIATDLSWQTAVFDLYNRMAEQGNCLIIVANQAPAQLGLQLADLVSRLQACTSFQLRLLSDADKQLLLQHKAHLRGMELSSDVARYLLNRQQRDIRALLAILDALDQASIVHQRKITIPFVKAVLADDE